MIWSGVHIFLPKKHIYLQTSNTSSFFENIWGGKHTSPQKKWVPSPKRPIPLAILYFLNRSGVADIMCCAEFVTNSYVEFVTYSCVDIVTDSNIKFVTRSYVKFVTHSMWNLWLIRIESAWCVQMKLINIYSLWFLYMQSSWLIHTYHMRGEFRVRWI